LAPGEDTGLIGQLGIGVARGEKPPAEGPGRNMSKKDSTLAQVVSWIGRGKEYRNRIAMGTAGVETGEKGRL